MNRRSLSLIEVVLTIVILGLTVPALMIQLHTAIRAQATSIIQLNLAQLATQQINQIHTDRADTTRGYAYLTPANYPTEQNPAGITGYTRQTHIREVSPTDLTTAQPGSGIKRIRIEIAGPDNNTLVVESFITHAPAG